MPELCRRVVILHRTWISRLGDRATISRQTSGPPAPARWPTHGHGGSRRLRAVWRINHLYPQ
eukprot:8393940-Lingulodinium_polyedra.AAC.1